VTKTKLTTQKPLLCPVCNNKAKRVSKVTLGALLCDEFAQQFKADDQSCCAPEGEGCVSVLGDTGWRYCDSTDCDVVYFSEDCDTTFTKSQLKVAVGVKETSGERPLCYCFKHSVASIKKEIVTSGTSIAPDDIRAKMKDPGCRCETENPSGSCCLGSVGKGIKIAQAELDMSELDTASSKRPAKPSGHKGETIAKVGTLVSATMASACCWLPLVLLAVGVSGAGIASTLEEYRPYFMVITVGFLGAAFYFTYRPKSLGSGCCVTEPSGGDACCAPAARSTASMLKVNKVMLWAVTAVAIAFLFFPSYVGIFLKGNDTTTITEQMTQTAIKIEGMTCEGCSALVADAIKSTPGVLAVQVDYEKGEALVGSESCCPFPKEDVLASIQEAGYSGSLPAE
tara:strand:- start:9121 stop:10311 length:1191 start_codon:yes stop_codon:yes gene_type:complete